MTLFGEPVEVTLGDAELSDDGRYRYDLTRRWRSSAVGAWRSPASIADYPTVVWVMLNPSTADALTDDATIRRCRYFSEREGADQLAVINLVPLRARHPTALRTWVFDADALFHNMAAWTRWLGPRRHVLHVICAWGACPYPIVRGEAAAFRRAASRAHRTLTCLGTTKDGAPRHPLYLPNDTPLEPYPKETP